MAIPRASRAYSSLGRSVFRRAGTQSRTQAWRQFGRRQYATEHAKKSSELPWIIGSVAFTVPAAVWLMGQGPKKGAHGPEEVHEEGEAAAKVQEEPAEEPVQDSKDEKEPKETEGDSEQKEDDKKDEGGDEAKDESKDKSKDEGKEDKSDDSSSEGGDDKDTPATSDDDDDNKLDGSDKGPGEGQKAGSRKGQETQRERSSKKDESGAKNPYLDDGSSFGKSEKGEGVKETAKIHGTVDPNRPPG